MTSHYQSRKHRLSWFLGIFLLYLTSVSSHEDAPSNHRSTPDTSTLKIEARESEASIVLGKDLVLGPSLSTKVSTVANSSDFNDTPTKKIDSHLIPTITNRAPSRESGTGITRRPVSKDASSRWSSNVLDNRHWTGKSPKTAWKRDSYLEALRHSHTSDDLREGIVQTDSKTKANRRDYMPGPVQYPGYKSEVEYDPSDSTYTFKSPRIVYGLSAPSPSDSQSFKQTTDFNGGPQNSYGPPQNPYGPPPGSSFYPQTPYGQPGNSYLPPQQGYGTSLHASSPPVVYSAPYSLPDVSHISILPSFDLWPFVLKLNAFTIAKIILKLVIFKMIVKFIAVICLLLFIPKLEIIKKTSNKEDDDEERSWSSPYANMETLNNLETIVKSSVEKYEAENDARSNSTKKCTTVRCRVTEAFTFHESSDDYLNLFKRYVEEERRQITKREEQ